MTKLITFSPEPTATMDRKERMPIDCKRKMTAEVRAQRSLKDEQSSEFTDYFTRNNLKVKEKMDETEL